MPVQCSTPAALDTLVLKVSSYMKGLVAAAAIDARKNFAKLVLQDQGHASNVQIPPDVLEKNNRYMSTKTQQAPEVTQQIVHTAIDAGTLNDS